MQTALYKISFKDGRVFKVFCANRKQNKTIIAMANAEQDAYTIEVIEYGIHTFKQWKEWAKALTTNK